MKKFSCIALSLFLGACSSFSDSEVIMRASPETRSAKPHMPPIEKPLQAPHDNALPIPIAPQIGVRLPLGK